MATRVSRTSTLGSLTTWTWSGWVKRGKVSSGSHTLFASITDGNNYTQCYIDSGDDFRFLNYVSSSTTGALTTDRKFRDPGAWYHIVVNWDSSNASAGDRIRLYVNGVEETSFSTDTQPGSSDPSTMNKSGSVTSMGGHTLASEDFYGELSHCHFIDGTIYGPTTFGEFDTTSGIWKPKTAPSVTYGTNGWFLKFEDRTNLDLDSGTNAFTFTTTGTLTATYDSPSNNFCTMNPLNNMGGSSPTFSNGNNTYLQGGTSQYFPAAGTTGLEAGLWYWECSFTSGNAALLGVAGDASIATNMAGSANQYLGWSALQWALYVETGVYYNGTTGTSYGVAVAADDIIGVYLDLTANKLYFAKDGVIMNSGTGISITAAASTSAGYYIPSASYWGSNTTFKFNFGNGYLGTTAVTSAVADAGGIGAFEYDPSDGGASSFDSSAKDFRAICTKNIATYG